MAVPEIDLHHTFAKEETLISKDNKNTISVELPFSYFIASLKLPYPKLCFFVVKIDERRKKEKRQTSNNAFGA